MKTGILKIVQGIIFVMIFLMMLSCEKNQNNQPSGGSVMIGIPASINLLKEYRINENLSFSIDSISDYRCPADLICIWGGDVDLLFNINNNGVHIDTLIHAFTNRNNPFIIAGYKWEVTDVSPLHYSNHILQPEEYQIEILISKN